MTNDKLNIELSIYEKLKKGNTLTSVIEETKREHGLHLLNKHDVYFKELPVKENEFYGTLFKLPQMQVIETVGDYCIYENPYYKDDVVFGRDLKSLPMMLDYFEFDLYSLKNDTIEMVRYMIDIHGSKIPFLYRGELIISENMKPVMRKAGITEKELERFDFFKI